MHQTTNICIKHISAAAVRRAAPEHLNGTFLKRIRIRNSPLYIYNTHYGILITYINKQHHIYIYIHKYNIYIYIYIWNKPSLSLYIYIYIYTHILKSFRKGNVKIPAREITQREESGNCARIRRSLTLMLTILIIVMLTLIMYICIYIQCVCIYKYIELYNVCIYK